MIDIQFAAGDLALPLILALTFGLYLTGVKRAWSRAGAGSAISVPQAVAGAGGFVVLAVALSAPLETLSGLYFSAHMVQHLLLVSVAAPLLVLGAPLLALLWLLPRSWRRIAAAPLRPNSATGRVWQVLSGPLCATALFVVVIWGWHLPLAYEAALAGDAVHGLEHITMLVAAGLFWWAALQPMGTTSRVRFVAPLPLFAAAMSGGLLGAMITLAKEPWYGHYEAVAQALEYSALADQQLAGLLMWIPPGGVYLLLAVVLLFRALGALDARERRTESLPPAGDEAAGGARGSTVNSIGPLLIVTSALLLGGTGAAQVLEPAGPAAAGVSRLFWVMVVIATAICLLVFVLTAVAVFRRRSSADSQPPLGHGLFVVLGGIVLPLIILLPLLVWSLGLTESIVTPSEEAVTIEVVGHQWWWEVRYPDQGVVGANEIHVPVGVPVRLELSSVDVIHSFWAPGLQGKMDLVPGSTNTLWIEASEAGVHTAKCAEYCGAQHANMRLLVVSEPAAAFDQWMAERQETPTPPREPLARRGQEVFLSSACVYCHNVEGTNASGRIGPDLTHIASRMTLGAGTVANNRGNLGGWIVNSQALKPGNRMPPMYLGSDELQALLAYLETLE